MSGNCSGCCSGTSGNTVSHSSIDTAEITSGYISEFNVPKMDCPSEEQMIRMVLDDITPHVALDINIPNRQVRVFHQEITGEIQQKLESLEYGAVLIKTYEMNASEYEQSIADSTSSDAKESRILKWLLLINGTMFFTELFVGCYAQSAGLIADSLDMFADAAVYGLALYAVGRSIQLKHRAAHISGWLQLILALGVLTEVLRRFIYGSDPVSTLMIVFGFIALIANVICLSLIFKSKDSGAHMKASWIFSANDVIANLGIILAGFLVAVTGSPYPDLIIGILISIIVLNGARRILKIQ
ncbi:MAG: cation transporter [gamma proteobacterium symbiont of Bathyaustriella thionipta]|nr:cation transporter [gamma proteobacterium symbiont of Bathyaustriella thionipta]MCU7949738.1 cation transporter [gamma proteobacterium symbiont of Bathyaustriella thionipta]MCU7952850.1 cation transporter [gamma proteobacterium symbiont of Bathyaustriella thionipta]MCU7956320.1 cation transporter [gamma proteobacterium symbiont of Bathyaustriella thionipta]MCU7968468.1 cation transporter [gamma proteobacterium symbiont of Bathyaustriella thionipta]